MNSKFRVWDGDEMHLPPHRFVINHQGYVEDPRRDLHAMFNAKPLHYTGLDDAEGTPVYEGDLIETIWNGGTVGVVTYENGCWFVRYDEVACDRLNNAVREEKWGGQGTVVGNRFENETPELLKD